MAQGRHAPRVGLVLATLLALLAVPALPRPGTPPGLDTSVVALSDWRADAGWQVARVRNGDAVLLAADLADGGVVELRSSRDGTTWTPWQPVPAAGEHQPDPGAPEAHGVDLDLSEPVWVGGALAVEARVPRDAVPPRHLVAVSQRGGHGLAWEPGGHGSGAAHAASVWPAMVPRSVWDPEGECRPAGPAEYAPAVVRAYVHHTAIFPDYAAEETDDLVRAMCVFHVERRGFDDIGYNFLVDRYGRIYQGRAGGILRPVVGAHASGFNRGSVGIALIGNFDGDAVPPAALESLDRLLTWLFEWHGIDPYAVTPHVSTGGRTTPHPAGEAVLLPAIVGHRQTATNTSCPGDLLYEHVSGADPATHRIAARLRDLGVEVGDPVHPPAEPRVVPDAAVAAAPEVPAAVGRVLEGVVAAVRTLATRRIDERLLPALGGG